MPRQAAVVQAVGSGLTRANRRGRVIVNTEKSASAAKRSNGYETRITR